VPSIQWFLRVYVGESGGHEGLLVCGRLDVHENLCVRVSGATNCTSRLSIFSRKVNMPEIVNYIR